MRIALLSTYYENAGDDLIREGIQHKLRLILGCEPRWFHVSKSNPLSLILPHSARTHAPVHRMRPEERVWVDRVWSALNENRIGRWLDRVRHSDLFVFAGTPLFYFVGPNSFIDTEERNSYNWPNEIFARRLEPSNSTPFVALGIGSIYEGTPESVLAQHPKAADFLRRFLRRARLVTTRDAATHQLLLAAAPEWGGVIIPSVCPSLWAQHVWDQVAADQPSTVRNRVVLGYSTESSDWDLTMPRSEVLERRRCTLGWVIEFLLQNRYEVSLVAHNQFDIQVQTAIADEFKLAPPVALTARELVMRVNQSAFAVTWRIHGALAALAAARPVLLFKTDSRWRMAESLGASILDDRHLTKPELMESLTALGVEAGVGAADRFAAIEQIRTAEQEKLRGRLLDVLK